MSNMKKRLYQPPKVRDLSSLIARGQVAPEGSCEGGGNLTFQVCRDGGTPTGGACSPTGFVPERGYCDFGDKAVEGCTSGTQHF